MKVTVKVYFCILTASSVGFDSKCSDIGSFAALKCSDFLSMDLKSTIKTDIPQIFLHSFLNKIISRSPPSLGSHLGVPFLCLLPVYSVVKYFGCNRGGGGEARVQVCHFTFSVHKFKTFNLQ